MSFLSSREQLRELKEKLAQAEAHIRGLESTQRTLVTNVNNWRGKATETAVELARTRTKLAQAHDDVARLADLVEDLQMQLAGYRRNSLAGVKVPDHLPEGL